MNSENQYDADDEREWDDCPEDFDLIESSKVQDDGESEGGREPKASTSEGLCEIIAVVPASKCSERKVDPGAAQGSSEKQLPKANARRCAPRRRPAASRVQRGRVTRARGDNFGVTPLHIAVERRSLALVKLLVKAGADVDAQDHSGRSPLHIACEMERMDLVQALLGMRANAAAGRRRIRQLHPPRRQAVRRESGLGDSQPASLECLLPRSASSVSTVP